MNNEEKILEMLEKLNERIGSIETGQAVLGGHLDRLKKEQSLTNLKLENLNYTQTAFEGRMARFESALGGMQEDIAGLKDGQAQMQDVLTAIKVRLDYDVDVRLKAISEDIDVIKTKLETLDEVKELTEKTADKVDVIHAVVAKHGAAISELKQAQ